MQLVVTRIKLIDMNPELKQLLFDTVSDVELEYINLMLGKKVEWVYINLDSFTAEQRKELLAYFK